MINERRVRRIKNAIYISLIILIFLPLVLMIMMLFRVGQIGNILAEMQASASAPPYSSPLSPAEDHNLAGPTSSSPAVEKSTLLDDTDEQGQTEPTTIEPQEQSGNPTDDPLTQGGDEGDPELSGTSLSGENEGSPGVPEQLPSSGDSNPTASAPPNADDYQRPPDTGK